MRFLLVITLFFSTYIATAQSNRMALISPMSKSVTVDVQVLDEENAMEPLAFATVIIKEKGNENLTDEKGEYTARLKPGTYTIEVQFIGYESKTLKDVKVTSGNPLQLKISLKALQLEPSVNFAELFSEKSEH